MPVLPKQPRPRLVTRASQEHKLACAHILRAAQQYTMENPATRTDKVLDCTPTNVSDQMARGLGTLLKRFGTRLKHGFVEATTVLVVQMHSGATRVVVAGNGAIPDHIEPLLRDAYPTIRAKHAARLLGDEESIARDIRHRVHQALVDTAALDAVMADSDERYKVVRGIALLFKRERMDQPEATVVRKQDLPVLLPMLGWTGPPLDMARMWKEMAADREWFHGTCLPTFEELVRELARARHEANRATLEQLDEARVDEIRSNHLDSLRGDLEEARRRAAGMERVLECMERPSRAEALEALLRDPDVHPAAKNRARGLLRHEAAQTAQGAQAPLDDSFMQRVLDASRPARTEAVNDFDAVKLQLAAVAVKFPTLRTIDPRFYMTLDETATLHEHLAAHPEQDYRTAMQQRFPGWWSPALDAWWTSPHPMGASPNPGDHVKQLDEALDVKAELTGAEWYALMEKRMVGLRQPLHEHLEARRRPQQPPQQPPPQQPPEQSQQPPQPPDQSQQPPEQPRYHTRKKRVRTDIIEAERQTVPDGKRARRGGGDVPYKLVRLTGHAQLREFQGKPIPKNRCKYLPNGLETDQVVLHWQGISLERGKKEVPFWEPAHSFFEHEDLIQAAGLTVPTVSEYAPR